MSGESSKRETEGGQGCVILKQLPKCTNATKRTTRKNEVMKIYGRQSTYQLERDVASRLDKIPGIRDYIVYPHRFCQVDDSRGSLQQRCRVLEKKVSSDKYYAGFMDRMEETLEQREDRGRGIGRKEDAEERFTKMFLRVLDCLEKLHDENMVYVDVKSDNLMFDSRGTLRFIDLGYVYYLDDHAFADYSHQSTYVIIHLSAKFLVSRERNTASYERLLQNYVDDLNTFAYDSIIRYLLGRKKQFERFFSIKDLSNFAEYAKKNQEASDWKVAMMKSNDVFAAALMIADFIVKYPIEYTLWFPDSRLEKIFAKILHHDPLNRPSISEIRESLKEGEKSRQMTD